MRPQIPDQAPRTPGLGTYLKEAFTWRWNLLALFGATAFAVLSPIPGVMLPVVAAAELAYLAGLISVPKFRRAIDAKYSGRPDPKWDERPEDAEGLLSRILAELAPGPRRRFLELRDRCLTLRRIASGVRAGQREAPEADVLRGPGLDKLLWVFLRLLHAQQALWKFLEHTDSADLERQLKDLERRRSELGETPDERMHKALTDAIATTTLRLDNLKQAERNAEYFELELDRIENKILALSELGVHHQNPEFITEQVDSVADSMAHTETAIREINAITGLSGDMSAPPRILSAQLQ